MKAKSFEEFINEREEVSNELSLITESTNLNESAAAAIMLASQITLLVALTQKAGLFNPVESWFVEKIDIIKSKIRRYKKKKLTNSTYEEFAAKIPEIVKELQSQWESEIERLTRELESALAAKENFEGDKRRKEWGTIKRKPMFLEMELKKLQREDFFTYIYKTSEFIGKSKDNIPVLNKAEEEQYQILARMIKDYVKDGKIKDTYWTERKYK